MKEIFSVYPQEYPWHNQTVHDHVVHNQTVKVQTSLPLHFSWRHVRKQPLSHALGGISSAHISTFQPTSAQPIPILRHIFDIPCAHLDFSTDICAADPRSTPYIQLSLRTCRLAVILSASEESDKRSIPHENKSIISFTQILHYVQDDRTVSFQQILHYASGFLQDDRKKRLPSGWQEETLYGRTIAILHGIGHHASLQNSYFQYITIKPIGQSPQKNRWLFSMLVCNVLNLNKIKDG